MLDQNALPKRSLGEDWGKNNFAKAYVAMKNFQILPLDTSIANTENSISQNPFQVMNLEQTNRMMSRIQMANYFKQQCFEVIGITPQRLGQQMGQIDTAKGVEQAMVGSFAQTENFFINHSDYLMPRVHQMRTDLAMFYNSRKPSLRLQYMTSADEKVNFEMNGTDLLLRDLNVFATTKANQRAILEQMKQLAFTNNTAGATIYDLGTIMQTESVGELTNSLKSIERKANKKTQEEQQHQQEMQEQEMQTRIQEKQMQLDHDMQEKEKDRRKDILIAEIKSAGYGAMQDINANQQSDYLDALDEIKKSDEFQQSMNLQNSKESNRMTNDREKAQIEREKLAAQLRMKNTDLEIARENKNKFDAKKKDTKKKK
jgi:hypothetical protein